MSSLHASPAATLATGSAAPTHADITRCAHDLWASCGRPVGRDEEIWLEAERRLRFARWIPLFAADLCDTLARQRSRARSTSRALLLAGRMR